MGVVPGDGRNLRTGHADVGKLAIAELGQLMDTLLVARPHAIPADQFGHEHGSLPFETGCKGRKRLVFERRWKISTGDGGENGFMLRCSIAQDAWLGWTEIVANTPRPGKADKASFAKGPRGRGRFERAYGAHSVSARITDPAARRLRAAIVRVGLAVPDVGKTPLPRMKRLRCSCVRRFGSTTDLLGSVPMRVVPRMCPGPSACS